MTADNYYLMATVAWGAAVAAFAWWILGFLTDPYRRTIPLSSFEQARRQKMRAGSGWYQRCEPGLERLAGYNEKRHGDRMEELRRNLVVAAEPLPYTPGEYLARRQLESILAGVGGLVFGLLFFGDMVLAVVVGVVLGFLYLRLTVNQIHKRAQRRLQTLKRRLPFAIDLTALMMEAGASFQEALATVVRESKGHPLAEELSQVLRDISLGRTRQEALLAWQKRLVDEDIAEIVFAVNKGEELGTPLAQILRNQAEQMRLKRSQWMEKATGEAQVNIVFPGMVIMIACLIIVVAPFILGALNTRN